MSFAPTSASPDIEKAPSHLDEGNQEQSAKSRGSERPESSMTEKQAEIEIDHPEDLKKVQMEKVVVLSFRTLQLQRITELQDELLGLAYHSVNHTPDKDVLDRALRSYAEALRNYETLSLHAQSEIPPGARLVGKLAMAMCGTEGKRRIFSGHWIWKAIRESAFYNEFTTYVKYMGVIDIVSPTYTTRGWLAVGCLLQEDLKNGIPPSLVLEFMEKTVGNLGFRELDQRGRVERSQKQVFTQRVAMAIFGGAALIGPMLIMTLHPSRNTSLITVSVATLVFALVLAFSARDSTGKDVLGVTAAYAAVLVVFVGTSMAPAS